MKFILLALALFGIALYGPLNHRHAKYYWKSAFDSEIPFLPIFVIPYLGLFPFLTFAFATLFFTPLANSFYTAIAIASITAALFWYFFPTGFRRPRHIGKGELRHMLKMIYHRDHNSNAFPSSHVFLSLIAAYYLAYAFPLFALLICIVGACISVSTVFIRQHEVLDIAGGVFWAAGSITLVFLLSPI
jgi:membrane-associated phospholipid phosphatase